MEEEFGPTRRWVTITIQGLVHCNEGEQDQRARHIGECIITQLDLDEAVVLNEASVSVKWGSELGFEGREEGQNG